LEISGWSLIKALSRNLLEETEKKPGKHVTEADFPLKMNQRDSLGQL